MDQIVQAFDTCISSQLGQNATAHPRATQPSLHVAYSQGAQDIRELNGATPKMYISHMNKFHASAFRATPVSHSFKHNPLFAVLR
jgi:hypothetical protein